MHSLPKDEHFVERIFENNGQIDVDSDFDKKIIHKLVNLSNIPPRYIPNKWKTHLFSLYWWSENLVTFINWVVGNFEEEDFFMFLNKKKIKTLQLQFKFLFHKLKVNM